MIVELKNEEIEYRLHPKQHEVFIDDTRFKVLVAGRRFGKTVLALIDLLIFALSQDNALCWYVGPTFRQSKRIAWRLLKKLIPEDIGCRYNESELSAILPNGSMIELLGADNEDSLRGSGVMRMVIDEFATIYNNWSVWYEVLRPALTDHLGACLFIGTPKGKDPFYELFLKGQRNETGWKSWQLHTLDNPYIPPSEIAEAKRDMPGRYFRQEYEASFEGYVGLIYPEFSDSHIVKPFYLQDIYQRIGAIDPAISGTTAGLKAAIDEDGNLIIYEEYYEKNMRVSEVCADFKDEKVKWYIDPASQAKNTIREGNLYSLFDEYKDHGIYTSPADNDVESGINRVGEYLKQGKIRIFSTCTNLIWELERYHWAEVTTGKAGEPKAKPYKKNDHLCDCLKYLVSSRFMKTDVTYEKPVHPNSPLAKMRALQKRRARR